MKPRTIALVLAFTLASAVAHAQAGVYVLMEAQQFTQEGVDFPPFPNSMDIDRPWLFGPAFGAYLDVTHLPRLGKLKTGPVVFGFDARGDVLRDTIYKTQQFDRADGLFSLRVATKSAFKGYTPYVQGGFGIGHTRVPFRPNYANNFAYQFGIGVDRKIRGRLDWRVAEANAGFLQNYSTGYYPGGVGPNQSNYTVSLGTGIVFRVK
jgi:hypothetical protein